MIGHYGLVASGPELTEFTLDGASFDDLAGFFRVVGETLGTQGWGKNLDAFNDILRGGFGTPDEGFVLKWDSSAVSAQRLGWEETIRWLERALTTCHPDNVQNVRDRLAAAQRHEGETLFDIIVEIIRDHGPGGPESEDNVHLILA